MQSCGTVNVTNSSHLLSHSKKTPDPQNMQVSAKESRLMSTSIKEKLHQQQQGTRHWYQTVNDSHPCKQIY